MQSKTHLVRALYRNGDGFFFSSPLLFSVSAAFILAATLILTLNDAVLSKKKDFILSEDDLAAVSGPVAPQEDEEEEEEDSVQFSKLSYMGCTWVKAPRNEAEAQKAMSTLKAECPILIPITLHVPNDPDGCVR